MAASTEPRGAPAGPGRLAEGLSGLVNWLPRPEEAVAPVRGPDPPRALRRGDELRVLSWNLQFCATRRWHFFYDGGPDVYADEASVRAGLDAVGRTLGEEAADLVLLQEVDRDSARTGRVDELAALRAAAPHAAWASTPYHRSRYVPHPPRRPLGRMHMDLAVLSRFALDGADRLALPPLREPWLRRQFNLQRAVLAVDVPVADGPPLAVAVTHLSAFSRGDGTMPRQVAALAAWMEARRAEGRSFVLGGDLNLLPPGDDPARLGPEAAEYADRPNPIEALIPRFRSAVPAARLLDPALRTYLPPGAERPDRVLDYLFVSDDIEVVEAGPLAVEPWVSDHRPLRAHLRLR